MTSHPTSLKTNQPLGSNFGLVLAQKTEYFYPRIRNCLSLELSIYLFGSVYRSRNDNELRSRYLCFTFQAEHLRKKVTRFEDENESLMMQLKKMATRSRSTIKITLTL